MPSSPAPSRPRKAAATPGAAALADATSLPAMFLRRWQAICRPDVWDIWDREWQFCPDRKWRLDLAFVARRIAVELHGGVYAAGRHVRGVGFTEDRRKMNEATARGWKVFEVTKEMLDDGETLPLILAAVRSPSSSGPAEGA